VRNILKSEARYKLVFIGFCIYVVLAGLLIVLFDIFNLFGVRTFLEDLALNHPRVWLQLFLEGGPTEVLQWLALGFSSILSCYISGQLGREKIYQLRNFWFFLSIFLLLLVLEDAGNISHTFSEIMENAFPGNPFLNSRAPVYSFYFIIGILPILFYFKEIFFFKKFFSLLTIGYFIYGLAGFQSVFLDFLGINRGEIGNVIIYEWLEGKLHFSSPVGNNIGDFFMDTVVEETVELLGACFLLSAVIYFFNELKNLIAGDDA